MGRHHANGHVCYSVTVYHHGTARVIRYRTQMLKKPNLLPVFRGGMALLGALAGLLAVLGVATPDTQEPAVVSAVVTTTAPMMTMGLLTPTPVVEPPALTPPVARPLPVRVYPKVKTTTGKLRRTYGQGER